ncbi:unnamed protein product, partial [Brassica oleracea var. botrytis]
ISSSTLARFALFWPVRSKKRLFSSSEEHSVHWFCPGTYITIKCCYI